MVREKSFKKTEESTISGNSSPKCYDTQVFHMNLLASQKRAMRGTRAFIFKGTPTDASSKKFQLPNELKLNKLRTNTYQLEDVRKKVLIKELLCVELVELTRLMNCGILLRCSAKYSSIPCHVKEVTFSIICLISDGSVHCEQTDSLILIVSAHQVRLRNVKNTTVLADIASNEVIIEDCSNITFGSLSNGKISEPSYVINDLKWLKNQEKNPSISLLLKNQKIPDVIQTHSDHAVLAMLWKKLSGKIKGNWLSKSLGTDTL